MKVDATYTTPAENHNPMEPHATIAVWQGDDRVTLYDATQGIFGVRNRVAAVFDLPPERVRVINHYVGGGFGSKGSPWSHVLLAVMAARVVGRGVKLVVTRPQMFALVGHRPKTVQRVTLGAEADGRLVAIRHDVTNETSTFDEFVEPSAMQTRMLYACPNVSTSHRLVRIDVGTPTFQRAPGESTGTYALESAMDELAYALGMDPIALRVRNHADTDPEDGKPWSSKSLRECYRQAGERFGWAKRSPRPRSMRDGRWLVGWGMATATYPARQSPSSAIARLRPDGNALVQAGSQDIGTGTYTIMTQIAADALKMPYRTRAFRARRYDVARDAGVRRLADGIEHRIRGQARGPRAAQEARRKGGRGPGLAAPRVEPRRHRRRGRRARREGRIVRGRIRSARSSSARARRRSPPKCARSPRRSARSSRRTRSAPTSSRFACDEETREVRVARVVAAFAAGKILNAKTARSQLMGGLVWALGLALEEHTVRDARTARVVTRDLADYHVPVNADVPELDVIMLDEEDPHVNEVGAKGIGEIGITGAAAAIANAVYHATGKRIRDLPITLDKLL